MTPDHEALATAVAKAVVGEQKAGKKKSGPPQSEVLVRIAEEQFTVGQSAQGEPYAIEHLQPGIARPLRGNNGLRSALAAVFRNNHGKPPGQSALTDAIVALEAQAFDAERRELSLRVAQPDAGTLVVDLGEPSSSRCVVITADGYRVQDQPPAGVLFRRTALTSPLPEPADAGDLEHLAELTNVPDDDWPLVVALLVCAMFPDIPHPITAFMGQQGTAKTTTVRLLVRMVDPSGADVRSAPRSVDEWPTAANGSWVVGLDNLSSITAPMQDALCRAATGEGIVRRKLYTDADVAVTKYRRVVLLTGIDLGALRGDLADRALVFQPERITSAQRRLESDLEDEFAEAWPSLLAGLYQLTARVLAVLPDVRLTSPPRMADFGRIVAAVDHVTGSRGLARYAEHAESLAADVLEADPVAGALVKVMTDRDEWTGTATDLLKLVNVAADEDVKASKWWPKDGARLSGKLTRAAPVLRQHAGIEFERSHSGDRAISLRRVDAVDATDADFGALTDDPPDAVDAVDADFPLSSPRNEQEREKEETEKAPDSPSTPSGASNNGQHPEHDDDVAPDLSDHELDKAPPVELVPLDQLDVEEGPA